MRKIFTKELMKFDFHAVNPKLSVRNLLIINEK